MKTPSYPSSPKGFTLVELLVVIAIIAVLASATFAIGPAMMNRARKVNAQASATSINNAIEMFYTEYSALPTTTANNASPTEVALLTSVGGTGVDIIKLLSGEDVLNQNPRKMRFLTGKEAKNRRDGFIYSGNFVNAMLDPWGQPFYIVMDYTYDESIPVRIATPRSSPTTTVFTLRGRRAAVYSLGVDLPTAASASTLVKTW
jgi:prepilin-type N-terminal cleavage/methylation domain-containing protein